MYLYPTYLSNRAKTSLELQFVHTLSDRFAMRVTLGNFPFASTTTDSDAVDNVALLSFVPKPSGFIWTGWPRRSVDGVELPVLPASYTQKKA
jgi:hypothetical protein